MVGAMALVLNEGGNVETALRLGTAAGAATAISPGTHLCNAEDVARLLPQVVVRPLADLPVA